MNPFIFTSEKADFIFTGYISYFSRTTFIFDLTLPKPSGWSGLEHFLSVPAAIMAKLGKILFQSCAIFLWMQLALAPVKVGSGKGMKGWWMGSRQKIQRRNNRRKNGLIHV